MALSIFSSFSRLSERPFVKNFVKVFLGFYELTNSNQWTHTFIGNYTESSDFFYVIAVWRKIYSLLYFQLRLVCCVRNINLTHVYFCFRTTLMELLEIVIQVKRLTYSLLVCMIQFEGMTTINFLLMNHGKFQIKNKSCF